MEILFISANGNGLLSALGIYVSLLGLGLIVDQVLMEEEKRKVADRLNNTLGDKSGLANLFLSLFDRVFYPNKIGRPRFLRSAAMSLVVMTIILSVWGSFLPDRMSEALKTISQEYDWRLSVIALIVLAISINLIGDFISLWETRILIGRMTTAESNKRQAMWLITDLVLTVMIYCLGFLLGLLLLGLFERLFLTDLRYELLAEFKLALINIHDLLTKVFFDGGLTFSNTDETVDFFVIFFYTTLFTSIWVWVFMLGITLWPLLRWIHRATKVDTYPVLVATAVGGVFTFPILAVVLAVVRLFSTSS